MLRVSVCVCVVFIGARVRVRVAWCILARIFLSSDLLAAKSDRLIYCQFTVLYRRGLQSSALFLQNCLEKNTKQPVLCHDRMENEINLITPGHVILARFIWIFANFIMHFDWPMSTLSSCMIDGDYWLSLSALVVQSRKTCLQWLAYKYQDQLLAEWTDRKPKSRIYRTVTLIVRTAVSPCSATKAVLF